MQTNTAPTGHASPLRAVAASRLRGALRKLALRLYLHSPWGRADRYQVRCVAQAERIAHLRRDRRRLRDTVSEVCAELVELRRELNDLLDADDQDDPAVTSTPESPAPKLIAHSGVSLEPVDIDQLRWHANHFRRGTTRSMLRHHLVRLGTNDFGRAGYVLSLHGCAVLRGLDSAPQQKGDQAA